MNACELTELWNQFAHTSGSFVNDLVVRVDWDAGGEQLVPQADLFDTCTPQRALRAAPRLASVVDHGLPLMSPLAEPPHCLAAIRGDIGGS
jgi:hypothetical protein